MLEKPIALELWEADELIQLAKRNNLKFTIGYSQRFNTKIAYAKKKITDGTLGKVVSVLVSRHLSRALGKKIASRVRLSPVVMESTHDLDFVFWLLEPAKPVRVYSQGAYGYMQPVNGSHDVMFTTVTMDNGVVVMIGGGWNLPPSYPNYCATWIEITGTEGALVLDDTQRDNWLNTDEATARNSRCPPCRASRSTTCSPAAWGPETIHFLEACIRDTPVMVTPESARRVMETYSAADLSADRNEPVDLPLTNETISAIAEFKQKIRAGVNHVKKPPRASASRSSAAAASGCSAARSRRAIRRWNGSASPRRTRTAPARSRPRSAPISSPRATSNCSSARKSPPRSSAPTSTCTSIRSWRRSSAACRC